MAISLECITTVGVDIDRYTDQDTFCGIVVKARERAERHGKIILDVESKRGHHLKIKLDEPVNFMRSIEIRYHCFDDPKRMFFDVMRVYNGGTMIDTLFDVKTYNNPK